MDAVRIDYQLAVGLDQVSAALPFSTGKDMLDLLATLSDLEQIEDVKPRRVEWRLVDTDGRNVALRSISEPDVAANAALSLVRGFDRAEEEEKVPARWNLEAASHARRIAGRLGETSDTGLALSVEAAGVAAQARVTRRADRHLRIATELRFASYGSVTGILGRVAVHPRRRATLWSEIDGRRVEVRFGDQHVEDIRNAWAHRHVEVTGVLRENPAGQVLQVEMDSLQLLDAPQISLAEALPRGLHPDLTGGLHTVDYLRIARGEK